MDESAGGGKTEGLEVVEEAGGGSGERKERGKGERCQNPGLDSKDGEVEGEGSVNQVRARDERATGRVNTKGARERSRMREGERAGRRERE